MSDWSALNFNMNSVQQVPAETIREHVDREMLMWGQLKESVGHMAHLDRKMAERTHERSQNTTPRGGTPLNEYSVDESGPRDIETNFGNASTKTIVPFHPQVERAPTSEKVDD